jgi:AsmA protein
MALPRKLLIGIGILLGMLLVAAIALPFIVDVNRFKPLAEAQAKAALGREVKIGDLELSLLRGGVKATDVSIADDPSFSRSPFLTAKTLNVGVEMWPLIFSREIKVTSLSIEEPQIQLIRSGTKWNFSSLGASAAKKSSRPTAAAPPVAVGKLRIDKGTLNVAQAGQKHTYDDVNVEVRNFSMTSAFPFGISAKTPGGGTLKLDGEAGPISAEDAAATPMQAELEIKDLDIASSGFLTPGSPMAGKLGFKGTVKSDGQSLRSEGKATASQLKVVKGGAPARQAVNLDYAADLDVKQKKGRLTRGDITIGQSKAKLDGTFDTSGNSIAVNARLKGDAMPIDSLGAVLPAFGVILPQGSQLQGGTAAADLVMRGPVDRMVISGPVSVNNTKVSGFNLKSRASAISALAGMPSASDLIIQALSSQLRVAPEGIRADGINLVAPSLGSVTGDGTIGNDNSLNFKMRAKLEGGGGLAGGLSTLSTLGQSKGEIPFLIQGTTSNPVFLPDVAGALAGTVKAPVQTVEGVGGMFGGLFGKKKKKE